MRSFSRLALAGIAAATLVGCGDPPPSTPIAPDVAPPDTSKFSQTDIDKFHQADHAAGSDRGSQSPPR